MPLAREQATPGSEQTEFLDAANMASLKARDLTHELMALSRSGIPVMKVGPIQELIKRTADSIPADSDISLKTFISKDLWQVPHDPPTLTTVFRNVATNAVEAMPHGGTLSVTAKNLRPREMDRALRLILSPIKYIHIAVQDQGVGIPGEDLDRIFDPYFSTKIIGVQKGMGLGLATTHAIIERHGGSIFFDSLPGRGTTVNIYLPVDPKVDAIEFRKHAETDRRSIVQRVLVMDDEEMLRNLARQMLNRLGYQAETVRDGVEAINAFKRHKESGKPFDMVILDLTVKGGMGGEQTVRELKKIDPNIKAIVSSGYYNDPVISNYEQYGFTGSMAKPYHIRNLKEAIEKLSH